MMAAARHKRRIAGEQICSLLEETSRKLDPFEDPLLSDLGLHRWLESHREEAYSDWLAWVVEQSRSPELVFRLFGIHSPEWVSRCEGAPLEVSREHWVAEGHEGRPGRLDLVIRYGNLALIVVEVKVIGADSADMLKQDGYMKWLKNQPVPEDGKHPILLATEGRDPDYQGFKLRRWDELCLELRAIVAERRVGKGAVAAMVLAFVGAWSRTCSDCQLSRRSCCVRAVPHR